MPKKVLAISSVIFLVAMILLGVLLWREKRNSSNTDRIDQLQETKPAENADQGTLSIPESTVASDWKTYRNEKYGFEFKLSNVYTYRVSETESDKGDVISLNSDQDGYGFEMNQGRDEQPVVGDRRDVSVRIYRYDSSYEKDFKSWVAKNDLVTGREDNIEYSGVMLLANGVKTKFVSRRSLTGFSEFFFSNGNCIVSLETGNSNFFKDQNPDYFSAILSTFRFTK